MIIRLLLLCSFWAFNPCRKLSESCGLDWSASNTVACSNKSFSMLGYFRDYSIITFHSWSIWWVCCSLSLIELTSPTPQQINSICFLMNNCWQKHAIKLSWNITVVQQLVATNPSAKKTCMVIPLQLPQFSYGSFALPAPEMKRPITVRTTDSTVMVTCTVCLLWLPNKTGLYIVTCSDGCCIWLQ